MAEVAQAWVSLLPSTRGFGARLTADTRGEVDSAGKKLGTGFGKVFALAGGALAAAGIGSFLKTGVTDARNYAKAFEATEAIIKATGGAANVTAEQVGKMSGRLEQMSGVDDEVIQKSANLLLTFKNVRNEVGKNNDIFNRASVAGLDLAAAGFGSPESAAKMLGKALNDPIKGISAMSRAGVTFTKQQQDQIKAMVESGDVLGAQKKIMAEVEAQVGGVAESQVTAADRAAVAWDNLRQQFGAMLLPAIDKVAGAFVKVAPAISAGMAGVGPLFSKIGGFLAPVLANFKEFGGTVIAAVLPVLQTLGAQIQGTVIPALAQVGEFVTGTLVPAGAALAAALLPPLGQLAAAIATGIIPAISSVVQFFIQWQNILIPLGAAIAAYAVTVKVLAAAQVVITTVTKGWAIAQGLLNAAMSANPIGLVVAAITGLAVGLVIAYKRSETFRNIVNAMWAALKVAGQWVVDIAKKVASFASEVGGSALSKVRAFASFMAGTYVGAVKTAIGIVGNIIGKLGEFGGALVDAVQFAARFASGVIEKAGQVVRWFSELPGKLMGYLSGLAARMYAAGSEMVSMLARGITDKIGAAYNALKAGASKLASLIPGSPVKEGPLKSLNNGHSGGEMMKMLGKGIKDNTKMVVNPMRVALEKVLEELVKKRDEVKGILDGLKSDFFNLSSSIARTFAGDLFSVEAREAIVPEFAMPEDFAQFTADRQAYWLDLQKKYQDMFTKPAQSAAEVFIENLMGTKGRLKQLMAAFKKLVKWGLSPQFLSQLFQSGNGGLILDLASGGRGQAVRAGNIFGDVESMSATLGNQVARNELGPRMDRVAERLDDVRKEIRETNRELKRTPEKIAQRINGSVRHGQRSAA